MLIKIAYRYCDNINVIVNKADNYKEAKHTMEKLFKAAEKFLNIKINYLGFLLKIGLCIAQYGSNTFTLNILIASPQNVY